MSPNQINIITTTQNSNSSIIQNPFSIIQIVYDFLSYHLVSIAIVSLIIAAILVNKFGSKKNRSLAEKTRDIIDEFMKKTFMNYNGQLVEESPNIIKLYASGRDTCIFGIFAFAVPFILQKQLIPRQQIISFFFNFIFFGLKDQLVIEIPLKTLTSLPLTMAIVRKKNIREITKKKYPDIKNLCKQYKPTKQQAFNVPGTHSILVQKKQHVQYLLATEKQVQMWQKYAKYVKLIYLSDINQFSRYPMALRMVINLNQEDLNIGGPGLLALLGWMITFIDRISKVKMPVIDKKEAKKKREGIKIDYDQY